MTFARYFVVGGAGFIGSHLVARLAERGPVTVFDDLSSGSADNIAEELAAGRARLIEASATDLDALTTYLRKEDVVFHVAGPPRDERGRWVQRDVEITTTLLEAMRRVGSRQLVFTSSGEIYGNTCEYCTEHHASSLPPSFEGGAKLASEALLTTLAHAHDIQVWMFRLGEVVGPRSRRGVVHDVMRAFQSSGQRVVIDGDPDAARPFVFVTDCVEGILFAYDRATGPLEIMNLAPSDYTTLRRVAELHQAELGGREGAIEWRAQRARNAPLQRRLDPSKLVALGWQTSRSSDEAVREALRLAHSTIVHRYAHDTPSRFAEL